MKKYFCPICGEYKKTKDIGYVCENIDKRNHTSSDDRSCIYRVPNTFGSFIPNKGKCPVCSYITFTNNNNVPSNLVCLHNDFYHKNRSVFDKLVYTNLHIVGIAGKKSSGKTVYLASLIDELKSKLSPYGINFVGGYNLEDKINSLGLNISSGRLPAATNVAQEPLCLTLFNEVTNKKITLCIYDAPGENFQNSSEIRDTLSFYLKNTNLFIDLIDPLQTNLSEENTINEIANKHIQERTKLITNEKILTNLNSVRKKRKPYLALCVSLFDVLKKYYELSQWSGIAQIKEFPKIDESVGSYSLTEAHIKSLEERNDSKIRDFLSNLEIKNASNYGSQYYKDYQLFCVSSLGTMPYKDQPNLSLNEDENNEEKQEDFNPKLYNPINVIDPIIWYLKKIKFFTEENIIYFNK